MVEAYARTFGYEAIITRCTNNYGPYQFPEKLIPLFVTNAQENKELPVYGDGMNVRDWIYVEDHCRAIMTVLEKGKPGEMYNVAGNAEKTNMDITRTVLKLTGKPETLIKYVKDRPGHDRRYSLDAAKIAKEMGWRPSVDFEEGIRRTVEWYTRQSGWWKRVKSGEYRDFYRKHYGM
jgi:dTDP-glucose 4,6-dehydratase